MEWNGQSGIDSILSRLVRRRNGMTHSAGMNSAKIHSILFLPESRPFLRNQILNYKFTLQTTYFFIIRSFLSSPTSDLHHHQQSSSSSSISSRRAIVSPNPATIFVLSFLLQHQIFNIINRSSSSCLNLFGPKCIKSEGCWMERLELGDNGADDASVGALCRCLLLREDGTADVDARLMEERKLLALGGSY